MSSRLFPKLSSPILLFCDDGDEYDNYNHDDPPSGSSDDGEFNYE